MTMKRNDDAVSPVIGVILMVAITVILAAVIAAFVFGLVGGVQGAKVVGLTVADNGTVGVVTWQGGADLGSITSANFTLDGVQPANVPWITSAPTAGSITYTSDEGTSSGTLRSITGKRLIIVAKFQDGSDQVIFDKQF